MKTLFFTALIICSFILTSCSRYQINVISSTNTNKNQQTGDFEFENDSVKISYSFYGPNAPVDVNVYNKLDNPLYIDWEKSAVIIGDKAISYASSDIGITGNVDAQTNTYRGRNPVYGNPSYTTGSINAVASLPQHSTFLPPHSQGGNSSVHLTSGFLDIPDSAYSKAKMLNIFQDSSNMEKVKLANFESANSPLVFKSYLTLYLVNGTEVKPIAYQQDFYISRSFTTLTEPQNFSGYEQKRGDYFISSKPTEYAGIATGLGVAAAIGAGAAINNSVK
jgi:hypothetical protein